MGGRKLSILRIPALLGTLASMISLQTLQKHANNPKVLAWGWILLLSYFTYFHNYYNPSSFFWDENYHVASAQKYLNGVYFMEPHPPLGKLLIALGEKIINPDAIHDQFLGTDYPRNPGKGFSFVGYRFFPTLLAWMIAPMLFGIFLLLTKNYLISIALSFLYIFDNALIVHSRSSMLESTLLFFVVAMILLFFLLIEKQNDPKKFCIFSVLFGCAFGALIATKANGLIMVLLLPALAWRFKRNILKFFEFFALQSLAFLIVYIAIWQIHFALGSTINVSLPDGGYYKASPEYREILNDGSNGSLVNFPIMIRDSWAFFFHYQRGVPPLDLGKADENGSPWFLWPVGARSIKYRWETPGNPPVYKYLYLQSNPVAWFFGLAGIVLSTSLLVSSVLIPMKRKLRYAYPMTILLGLYVAYMVAMSRIDRVMYLYHYFIPLILSFILFGLALMEIQNIGRFAIRKSIRGGIAFACALLIFAGYQFYRPLTYYEFITDEAFQQRNILRIWDLRCIRCKRNSPLVKTVR